MEPAFNILEAACEAADLPQINHDVLEDFELSKKQNLQHFGKPFSMEDIDTTIER